MKLFVGPNQSSFIPGQRAGDNIVLAQEVVHSLKKKGGKVGGMVVKIDLKKDLSRLGFLAQILA